MGHLGPRVSALLDGQLSPEEADRAWAHVHACHLCRDEVEREGWIKTRLAGLGGGAAPASLKGSLLDGAARGCEGAHPSPHSWATWALPPGDVFLQGGRTMRPRSTLGLAALGGGALGAAMMGVLAFGVGPADAPTGTPRLPTTSINQQVGPSPALGPRRGGTP